MSKLTPKEIVARATSVPAAGLPTPRGVTVHRLGDDRPEIDRPRNLIEAAAMCDDVYLAISDLAAVLGIANFALAQLTLSDARRWRQIPREARLSEIADWLRAECFECMDLVAINPPMSVVGTND